MPVIFRNPRLDDDFIDVPGVRAGLPAAAIPSIVRPYEQGRLICLPDLKLDLDHDFWADLPSEGRPRLKKLSSSPGKGDFARDPLLERRLREAAIPSDLERRLKREIHRVYEQVLPIYEAVFSGYRFVRRQVVWRLNTIRNENMHLDTYPTEFEEHFARLFINLDREPRIWMTSWSMEALFRRFGGRLPPGSQLGDPGEIRAALNDLAFGGRSNIWWDQQPRHVAHFAAGDVWAVDSRQLAHQIFYGRRAVSIDFFVDPQSMADPGRQYLALAETLRARLPAPSPAVAVAAE